MTPLPAGLAEPLHLLEPFNWRGLLSAALAAIVLAAIAYLLFRRRRSRGRRVEAPPPGTSLPRSPVAGIAAAIAAIRGRYSRLRRFRAGCHELSTVLRDHFGQRGRHRYSTLTAREIGERLGDTPMTRLLSLLAELQFGRREPGEADLETICDLAVEMVSRSGEGGR